jgi:hypothetical protein
MPSKLLTALFALGVLLAAGCGAGGGASDPNWTLPFQGDPSLPKQLDLIGNFESVPSVQVRSLPPSRMVQLQGVAQIEIQSDLEGLADQLDTADRAEAVWKGPDLRGCSLGQINLTRTRSKPLRFTFLFWGWDRENAYCEELLRATQKEGFNLVLKRVVVRGRGLIGEVNVKVAPYAPPTPSEN